MQTHEGTTSDMGEVRSVPLFSSAIQPTSEYRRDAVENTQGQMALTCGLCFHRLLALRNQSILGGTWY